MGLKEERKADGKSNSEDKLFREPIFGADAPPPEVFDPKDIKKSIYREDNTKSEHSARDMGQYHAERDLCLRYIQGWFYRCSWSQKICFISEICELTVGTFVLEQVLRCIDAICSKDVFDSFARDRIKFAYDIVPTDDNRALELSELEISKQNSALWFLHSDTATQIEVILKLLKLGGGGLIFNGYKEIDRMYRERRIMNMVLTAVDCSIRELNEESKGKAKSEGSVKKAQDNVKETPDKHTARKLEQISRRNSELNEFRKKYGLSDIYNDKAGHGKKREAAEVVDYVQILPLWLNRKIMLYMKEKELAELKKTGKYWTKMIEDALREGSGRAVINAKISRITGGRNGGTSDETEVEESAGGRREVATWGQESLLHVLGLKNSDLLRTREQNEAFKGKRLHVHVWDDTSFDKRCCSANPACKLLASSTQSKAVNFHSLRTGARTGFPVITCLPSTVMSMAIHDEGFHLVVGCEDGTLHCMSMRKNERTISYKRHEGAVIRLHISDDKLISASEDKTIRHFDLWSGLCLLCISVDASITSTLAVKREGDGRCVMAGTAGGKLIFIDLGKGKTYREVVVHDKEVGHLSEDDNVLVTASSDRTIRLWNLQHLEGANRRCEVKPLIVVGLKCAATAVECLGHRIFAACADGRLRVMCKLSGATIRVVEVTQKKPIMGIYVMQEKDTTKMIMWHESGIEMRSVSLGKFSDAKKKWRDTRPEQKTLSSGRKMFRLVPVHALERSPRRPWRVKRFKGSSAEDREKAMEDMSCTAEQIRSVGSKATGKDLLAEMLTKDQLLAGKENWMTFSLTDRLSPSYMPSLPVKLGE